MKLHIAGISAITNYNKHVRTHVGMYYVRTHVRIYMQMERYIHPLEVRMYVAICTYSKKTLFT